MIAERANMIRLYRIYTEYFENGMIFIVLAFISMLVIYAFDRQIRPKRLFVYVPFIYTIVFLLNPWIYILMERLHIEYAYSRLFWSLPIVFAIAYALMLIWKIAERKYYIYVAVIAAVSITIMGTSIIAYQDTCKTSNRYHIPDETIKVAEIILKDDARENKTVIAPELISRSIRTYTSRVDVMFGAKGWNTYYKKDGEIGNTVDVMERQRRLYQEINSDCPDVDYILTSAWLLEWQYVVIKKNLVQREEMEERWFSYVGGTDEYDIYGALVIPQELKDYMEQHNNEDELLNRNELEETYVPEY